MFLRRFFFVAGMSLVLLCASQALPSKATSILIINSYHRGYAWSDEEINGILESFASAGVVADPLVEHLDCKHFPSFEHFDLSRGLLKKKLSLIPVSLVFVLDNPALDFALKYRAELFPDIPIVFMGINGYRPEMTRGEKNITGVAEFLDVAGTVALARALQPETRDIVVMHDYTSTGLSTRREAEEQLRTLDSAVHVRYLPPLSIRNIQDTVRRLPPTSVVLSLSFSRDKDGLLFNHPDIARALAKASSVPVYAVHEEWLGFGIVGGSLLGGRRHAALAASLALRILGGEDASSIPVVMKNEYRRVIDFTLFQKFGLSPSRIPADVAVLNRPPGFYEVHGRIINFAAVIIFILALAVTVLSVNIVRRKKAEAALRESESQLHRAQSIARIGSWHLDGRLLTFESSSETDRLVGTNPGAPFTLKDLLAATMEEDRTAVEAAFRNACRDGAPLNIEFRLHSAGGRGVRFVRGIGEPMERGGVYDVFGTIQDITDRKTFEAERERLLSELAQKNRELENIVYVTSHDLRSPLINILGFGEQFAHTYRKLVTHLERLPHSDPFWTNILPSLTDDIETSLNFIQSSAKKMDILIGGLLRFSRIGRFELHPVPIDMNLLMANVVATLQFQIERTHASISIKPLPPCTADPGQINQVFSNLIDNALKYAAPGRPPVIVVSGTKQRGRIEYCVEDNGVGIAANQLNGVWELFHRLNPRGSVQGEGLGLPLVKKIVERHNGAVRVASAEGSGSSFFVELPIVIAE